MASAAYSRISGNKYIVDGNNICHLYEDYQGDGKVSVLPLLSILDSILDHGGDFLCFFDATILHVLKDFKRYDEAKVIDYLIENFPENFCKVRAGTRADGVILGKANNIENSLVISGGSFSRL